MTNERIAKAIVDVVNESYGVIKIDSVVSDYGESVTNNITLPVDYWYEKIFIEWESHSRLMAEEEERLKEFNRLIVSLGGRKVLPKPPEKPSSSEHPLWLLLERATNQKIKKGDGTKIVSFTITTPFKMSDIWYDLNKFKSYNKIVDEYNVDYLKLIADAILSGHYDVDEIL